MKKDLQQKDLLWSSNYSHWQVELPAGLVEIHIMFL